MILIFKALGSCLNLIVKNSYIDFFTTIGTEIHRKYTHRKPM